MQKWKLSLIISASIVSFFFVVGVIGGAMGNSSHEAYPSGLTPTAPSESIICAHVKTEDNGTTYQMTEANTHLCIQGKLDENQIAGVNLNQLVTGDTMTLLNGTTVYGSVPEPATLDPAAHDKLVAFYRNMNYTCFDDPELGGETHCIQN